MKRFLPLITKESGDLKYTALVVLLMCVGWAHAQVMSSSNPALEGQPVILTVQIEVPSGVTATPTGTVNFTDGGQNIGAAPVQEGIALFTAQLTGAGDHVIVADYSGDANFAPASGPPFVEHITADDVFTLSVSPSLITQHAGAASTLNLTLFSNGNSTGPVHFSCEGLPAGVRCSFQSDNLVPSADGTGTTATVSSAARPAVANLWNHGSLFYAGFFLPVLFGWRRRWLVALCAFAVLGIAGCGGKVRVLQGGTPAGSYTIHVTASDGTTTQQAPVKLTVT